MEVRKYHAVWRGAVILTLAGLVTKVLSAFYRIPFQNIAGDIGFYIYQQVYPIYGICLVVATYGFPSIISKLVTEEVERGNREGIHEIARTSFWFLLGLGGGTFTVLFVCAPGLAAWMGDAKLAGILQVAAFSLLLLPFLSVGRGVFQGYGNMVPTAISQVTEQAVRVSVIIFLSLYLTSQAQDLYRIGAGAMAGSAFGGMAAVIVLALFWRSIKHSGGDPLKRTYGRRQIIQAVFWQGLAVCISNLVLIFVQLIDAVSLYKALLQAGEQAQQAKIIKGIYDRGTPLIQLGTVVATSFSLPLIPLITAAKQKGDMALIRSKVKTALKITLVLGGAAATGLACIIRPTNVMLFENGDGSEVLAILALAILFGAFSITAASLLQGLGYMLLPAAFVVAGALVKWGGNALFIPSFGIEGAAWATVAGLMVTAVLNLQFLARVLGCRVLEPGSTLYILIACFGMAALLGTYTLVFESVLSAGHRVRAAVEALTAVGLGGLAYIILVFRLPVFSSEELGTVWHGGKLPRLLEKIRKE